MTVRLKFSPETARIVTPGAPRDLQVDAARGALTLAVGELLPVLLVFCHGGDVELRTLALETIRGLSAETLAPILGNPETHPQVLDLIARIRIREHVLLRPLVNNPALASATLQRLATNGDEAVLALLADNLRIVEMPEIVAAILANPHANKALKYRLGMQEEEPAPPAETAVENAEAEDEESEVDPDEETDPEEEINLSKYQQALEMNVAEKIKMALTGDKEWRTIFTKDSNKLVNSAVLKNPRITDGEVLAIAKNKGSNDEMIRLITMNREWVKKYEIQKALILHARTPLPKALRYMNVLIEKDLKTIAKSRGVAQVIVNNARRMVVAKNQKK
jgi:hypothetical protein